MEWIVGLLVWLAAGARVGRVIVRPATGVRVAIVIAMLFLAAAQTIAIDDVADALGSTVAASALAVCWAGCAGASAVIAARAWPSNPPHRHRTWTVSIAAVVIAAIIGSCWIPQIGWGAATAAFAAVIASGIQLTATTPIGTAIGLYTAGSAVALISCGAAMLGVDPARSTPGGILLTAAATVMSLAAVWVLAGSWIRARILLYRTATLHRTLLTRFPEIGDPTRSRAPTVLRASDHVSDIMDALYLQVGAGQYDNGADNSGAGVPVDNPQARAAVVARTVDDPLAHPILGTGWIMPPPGCSPALWVTLIARQSPLN